MFDIGFFELIVIAVLSLLIIGPERMPEAVRTVGLWIGRIKRSLRETRAEIEQQIGADDIRRQLHNEDILNRLNATGEDVLNRLNTTGDEISGEIEHVLDTDTIDSENSDSPQADTDDTSSVSQPPADK